MFIGDQEMFLRDTLDPVSKMHRLRADEHIPGNGRIGCDRRWQKKRIRCSLVLYVTPGVFPGGSLQAPPAFPMVHSRGIP